MNAELGDPGEVLEVLKAAPARVEVREDADRDPERREREEQGGDPGARESRPAQEGGEHSPGKRQEYENREHYLLTARK